MLTAKQEAFATCIFQGLSQRQAFLKAGYSVNNSVTTIDECACKLAKMPKIRTRIQELRDQVAKPYVASVTKRQQKLTELLESNYKPEDITPTHIITAIAELNRMTGEYTADRSQPEVYQTFVFVLPDGTKIQPGRVNDVRLVESD